MFSNMMNDHMIHILERKVQQYTNMDSRDIS